MRFYLRRLLLVVLLLTFTVLSSGTADAMRFHRHSHHRIRPIPDRFAEIVIEANSGYVLSERNADKRLYPASLTKMMTLYLTFEALEDGTLSKNHYIAVSRHAASQEPSSLGLTAGDTIRVEDCILAITTKSANDCAVTLAEALGGGSEGRFARAMTVKARELGMNGTHFVNASGLFNREQYSTARDMATMAQALIRDYPKYYHYFSTDSFSYGGYTYMNHNKLMSSYPGMDGLKTGYVYASGYNLAASAVHGDTRLIGVIFGGRTARTRNLAMRKLLDQSFARVSNIRVALLSSKGSRRALPTRRPDTLPGSAENIAEQPLPVAEIASAAPLRNAIVDQGDTTDATEQHAISLAERAVRMLRGDAAPAAAAVKPAAAAAVTTASAATARGNWAIQIGAFASHEAGIKALAATKASLPGSLNGIDTIAPLMTNRGMIYRARLSGLGRDGAAAACRILKGNCLILAVE